MSSYSSCSLQRVVLSGLAFVASSAAAFPSDRPDLSDINIPAISLLGGDVELRILPLGDVLTHGTSANPLSYRGALRDLLTADGNPVDYTGSSTSGSGDDNQVEAPADISAAPIATVLSSAKIAVPAYKPNLVIVNAGADDCRLGNDVSGASEELLEILKTSWTSIFATAVLTTLPPSKDETIESCLVEVNKQIAELVASQQAISRKVVLVDFRAEEGGVTVDDLTDEVDGEFFPSEEAYGKMATLLFAGIKDAASRGWLEAAEALPEAPESPTANATASATGSSTVSVPTNQASGSRLGGSGSTTEEAEENDEQSDETSRAAKGTISGLVGALMGLVAVGMTLL